LGAKALRGRRPAPAALPAFPVHGSAKNSTTIGKFPMMRLPSLPSVALLFLVAPVFLAAGPASASAPVGVETCRKCHPAAVEVWEQGPHARAERNLGTRAGEKACLICHAPLKQAKQVGVSCETCHGNGEHYAKSFVMRDHELSRLVGLVTPGEKACRTCHDATSPSLEPFDYGKKLPLLEHGRADREARRSGVKKAMAPAPAPAMKARPAGQEARTGKAGAIGK
jgi:hypothetical protein